MHRRDISQAKDTSSGNESAVPRKDEYRRRAEQMNKEKIKSDHRSSIQSNKPSEVDQESTSSLKDHIPYRSGRLELAKQSQLTYHQKYRYLTSNANQRDWHTLQGSNAKYKPHASHSTARELGVPKGGGDDDTWKREFDKWADEQSQQSYAKREFDKWADEQSQQSYARRLFDDIAASEKIVYEASERVKRKIADYAEKNQ